MTPQGATSQQGATYSMERSEAAATATVAPTAQEEAAATTAAATTTAATRPSSAFDGVKVVHSNPLNRRSKAKKKHARSNKIPQQEQQQEEEDSTAVEVAPPKQLDHDDLWERLHDATSGDYYYCNKTTQESVWEEEFLKR